MIGKRGKRFDSLCKRHPVKVLRQLLHSDSFHMRSLSLKKEKRINNKE